MAGRPRRSCLIEACRLGSVALDCRISLRSQTDVPVTRPPCSSSLGCRHTIELMLASSIDQSQMCRAEPFSHRLSTSGISRPYGMGNARVGARPSLRSRSLGALSSGANSIPNPDSTWVCAFAPARQSTNRRKRMTRPSEWVRNTRCRCIYFAETFN